MFFALCEQTADILNLKRSADLLFLMTEKFYRMLRISSYVTHMVGACFESRFYRNVKLRKIYNMKFINAEFMA